MKASWKPISTLPDVQAPTSCLIALRDTQGAFLLGLYNFNPRDGWAAEDDDAPLKRDEDADYYWIFESELVAPLDAVPVSLEFITSTASREAA